MAMAITVPSAVLQLRQYSNNLAFGGLHVDVLTNPKATATIKLCTGIGNPRERLLSPCNFIKAGPRHLLKSIYAVGSDPKASAITVNNVEMVVESHDDDKIQVRVDLSGKETQIVFDKVLANLARTAPPVPGFRRQKGGKTSNVPKSFLLQILGEERVTNFVIQEIVSSTLADFVKKENLSVKENKIMTIQSTEELKSLFTPGNEFGFNATLELEKPASETSSSSSNNEI